MTETDLARLGRAIIDGNLYMVLATADELGGPWSSPVYFAPSGFAEFFWVSSPLSTHSRNIAARPEVGIVIFDSQVPIGTGQAVYVAGSAEEVPGSELELGIAVFSDRSLAHGGKPFTVGDVTGDAGLRLYRAIASEHSMLAKDGRPDHRIAVDLGSRDDGPPPQANLPW